MAWKKEVPKQVTLNFSDEEYALLEKMIRDAGNVFKTVDEYVMFMAQNRIKKARGE